MNQLNGSILYLVSLFLLALLSGAGSNVALAQVSASMAGRVEDPSGAAIPGANVTLTSLETGAARTAVGDEAGRYQFLALPVGRYEVKAEKIGFKAAVQTGINLVVGQQGIVNLRLEVGTVQEQVTVTSDAPLVNTTTSSVAGLVGEDQVKDLPLNGRSFDLLITLNPGTVNYTFAKVAAGGTVAQGGNLFSVAGRRPAENITLLNGVQYSGTGPNINSPGGASGQLLGVDAVREYNVVSDGYGAEYGQRAGAQVSMVTQSGTNRLHGTLFEFLRNSALDARNFFDYPTGLRIPPFKRNQFGGALGGPIRKDKTFIFGNYEGFRQRLGLSEVVFVPDLNFRKGLLPCGASGYPVCAAGAAVGTPTPVPNPEPRILPYLNNEWPLPNGPNLGGGIQETFSNPVQAIREDFGTARFDQTFSANDTLSAIYTISDGSNISPGPDPVVGYGVTIRNQVASLQETHIFSPQVVNTFRAGFTRANYLTQSINLVPIPDSLLFVNGSAQGQLTVGNITNGALTQTGAQSPGMQFRRNLFTYSDDLQAIKGKHQISVGAWFQRIQQNDYDQLRGSGTATFSTVTTLLQGTVNNFSVAPKAVPNGWRSWEGAWYVQDSIQLRPNLTIRLGLRQEFSNGWSEVNGKAQTELFDQGGTIITLPRISNNLLTENNSKWLFSPRAGLAWDPFGNGKTSVRAAFGIYYDLADWLPYLVDSTPPLNGIVTYLNVPLFSVVPVNPLAAVPPPCSPSTPLPPLCNIYAGRGIQSNFKVPTVQSWNFSVEQQLTRSTALRLAYVGSHTYHQWASADGDSIPVQICSDPAGCLAGGNGAHTSTVPQGTKYLPVPSPKSLPNPYMASGTMLFSEGYGHYNALQMEVKERLTRGLQFRANYTWSKNLATSDDILSSQLGANTSSGVDRWNLPLNYARAGSDIRHVASGNMSYELPFGQGRTWLKDVHGVADKLISGWQFNSIVSLLSGVPFDVSTNTDSFGDTNTGGGNGRPNWNPAFAGKVINGTIKQWYNPQAFSLTAPGTYGNVGRDVLQGPGLVGVDFSLFKNTKISERVGLQFRAEVFNAINRANFSYPSGTVYAGTVIAPQAGLISSTTTSSRQIQFGLKLAF